MLGMAVQLCSLRHFGSFTQTNTTFPKNAEKYLRDQLHLKKCSLHKYFLEKITRTRHQSAIRDYLGFYELRPADVIAIGRAVLNRLLVSEETESVLIELVINVLLKKQVVLPGLSTIVRFVKKPENGYEPVCTNKFTSVYQKPIAKNYKNCS